MKIKGWMFLFLVIPVFLIPGTPGPLKKLTPEQALKGRLVSLPPAIIGWLDDDHYHQYSREGWIKVQANSGKTELISDFKDNPEMVAMDLDIAMADCQTDDYKRFLFVRAETIYLYLRVENKILPLIKTTGTPQNPSFSPDGDKIAYTIAGNLFVCDIKGEKPRQLTHDGSDTLLNGYASWIYYEEILGRKSKYKAFWWSPDSTRLAFMQFDESSVPVFPIYRPDGPYGSIEQMRYPKPGFPNPTVKIGIIALNDNQVQWLPPVYPEEIDFYLAFPTWNKKSDKLFFQWMNRDQDKLAVLVYDLKNKSTRLAYEEKQKEWVEFFGDEDFYVLEHDDLIIRSSKDGWFHLYYISSQGKSRQITRGDWLIKKIERVNEKNKEIFFTAAKESTTTTDFYKTDFNGKQIKRLTEFQGTHEVKVSPTGRYFIDQYSSVNTPPRVECRDRQGKLIRKIADCYSPEQESYQLAKGEIFKIKTEDGIELPVLWFLPTDLDKTRKYPVIIRVYGGPGSAVVQDKYPRSLAVQYLAQEGIISLYADHRGSEHFGKKGMAAMYHQLGKWEMADFIQVVKYLRTLPFIDSEKIGITGQSYGGYVAAMALTYGSEYFKYGISAAPVIDWLLYDSVYTERYMDTPGENPEGYRNSSVLTYIDKYKKGLRLTHGTMDDNVHLQNTLQFLDKVLDTGNTVELMLYPGERHGVIKKRAENRKSDLNFWLKNFLEIDREALKQEEDTTKTDGSH